MTNTKIINSERNGLNMNCIYYTDNNKQFIVTFFIALFILHIYYIGTYINYIVNRIALFKKPCSLFIIN